MQVELYVIKHMLKHMLRHMAGHMLRHTAGLTTAYSLIGGYTALLPQYGNFALTPSTTCLYVWPSFSWHGSEISVVLLRAERSAKLSSCLR